MSKMIDVLEHNLVQKFSTSLLHSTDVLFEQLHQGILDAPDAALQDAIVTFFNRISANDAAQALEIPVERIEKLQQGIALKDEQNLVDTLKVVTLGLAMETNVLDQIEVFDSLQDFPV